MVLINVSCHVLQENHYPNIELNRLAVATKYSKNVFAGGFHKFSSWQQFATNPKFKIVLKDKNKDGLCTFIVSLQTKLSGIEKKMDEVGFGIFKFKNNERLDEKFLKKSQNQVGNSGDSVECLPQVTKQFYLKPGKYIIVPFTKRANQAGDFLLRIFSEKPSDLKAIV
jgi:calpain